MGRKAGKDGRRAHGAHHGSSVPSGAEAGTERDVRRTRLQRAILHEVAHGGYTQAKIGKIAKQAGVSNKTFYGLYADKEECLLEALRQTGERIQNMTGRAIAQTAPEQAATAALGAVVDFAECQRDPFYTLTHEALFAGAQAVAERELLFARIHGQIEGAVEAAGPSARAPDIPAIILISGAIRALGIARRRGDAAGRLRGALSAWARSYRAPRAAHRWRAFTPEALLVSPEQQVAWPPAAQPRRKGPPGVPSAAVRRAERDRILQATAEVTESKGYAKMTVADIVVACRLSRDVFYAHFRGKQEAFIALITQIYEQTMGICAGAFFTSHGSWPERVWEAGEAMARFLASNPSLAYAAFAESGYVVGPAALRYDEMMLGLTVFLEEGYTYRPEAAQTPRLVGDAIAGATLETINRNIRRQRTRELPGLLPLATYMMLAPFTGTAAASQVIDRKLAEYKTRARGPAGAEDT